jgi:hypothetical protein
VLNGKREGWIEASIIVDGATIEPETPLVGAFGLHELGAVRKRLLKLPGAKAEGVELADGDVVLDFHRDEPGEDGGIEWYALDPVAFNAQDAVELLPAAIGIPREALLRHIELRLSPACGVSTGARAGRGQRS